MEKENKATSAEIVIGLGYVSPELTGAAETWLSAKFGSWFRYDGIGAYKGETQVALRYVIGTSEPSNLLWPIIADFAQHYCQAGAQESIYFVDKKGIPYLVFETGRTARV